MNLLFALSQKRTNAKSICPITCRITIAGNRLEISTNHFINPAHWDKKRKRAKGKGSDAINIALNDLENKLREIQSEFERENLVYTPSQVRDAYTRGKAGVSTWLKMYAYYVENIQEPNTRGGKTLGGATRPWPIQWICTYCLATQGLPMLTWWHLKTKKVWVEKIRQKKRKIAGFFKVCVPLYELPKAQQILEKYKLPLPKTLNKSINIRLKIIAARQT